MNKTKQQTYAAIISLTPPEAEGKITVHVTLNPSDVITDGEGIARPLGEFTLAELEKHAQEMETDFWEANKGRTLADLLADPSLAIDASLMDGDNSVSAETLLQKIVLIPKKDPELEAEAEVEVDVDVDVEKEPTEEIIVADSEPIHEERETTNTEAQPVPIKGKGREAGLLRRVGHPTRSATDILLRENPLRAMQKHALSSMRREVAGVLVGPQPEKQPDGRYVVKITDSIIAKHTRMAGASVTYTPESWRYLNDELHRLYPNDDHVMVGWYHTHPGFGIFLSNMDLFIHMNFFTQLWHVAYVLDPVGRRSGFFNWNRKHDRVLQYQFPWPEWTQGSW